MALPARLRVNAAFPFPSLVQGSGPLTVAKANGIWTLGVSADGLAVESPADPADFVLVWDEAEGVFKKVAIGDVAGGATQLYDTAHGASGSAAASHIPPPVNFLATGGYKVVGDGGGATYVKVGSINPSFAAYSFTSLDGANWQYIPEPDGWNAKVAGIVGDGSTDDSANVMAALLPFQSPAIIANGGGLTGTLLLPPQVMSLHSPIYITGTNGIAVKIQGQSEESLGGNTGTTFIWGGMGTFPTMVFIYGANQFQFESVNFIGTTGANLVNCVHVTADNSFMTAVSGTIHLDTSPASYPPGANTFTCDSAITGTGAPGLQVGASIGIGLGTSNFEIVYVTAVATPAFSAVSTKPHVAGEQVGRSTSSNNITFTRCTFGVPLPFVNNQSTGILVGNQIQSSVQAAQIIVKSCQINGAISQVNVANITIASPAVVTEAVAHNLINGTAIQFAKGFGGVLPTGLSADITYYVNSATTLTYQLALTPTGLYPGGGSSIVNTTGGSFSPVISRIAKSYAGLRAIIGNNIKNYYIENTVFLHSQYGIAGEQFSGTVEILYATFAGTLVADILAGGASNLNVTSCESESGGTAFVIAPAAGLNFGNVTLAQNSYQCSLPADGYAVKCGLNLVMINNIFLNTANATDQMFNVPVKIQGGSIIAQPPASLPGMPPVRPINLTPASIKSTGNYYQHGFPSVPVFYDSGNNAFDPANAAALTYLWRVTQENDYCDNGWYPNTTGENLIFGAGLSTIGISAGVAINPIGLAAEYTQSIVVPYTAINVASSNKNIALWTIPQHTLITSVVADVVQAFAGGALTSCLAQVGDAVAQNTFIKNFETATGTGAKGLVNADLGPGLDPSIYLYRPGYIANAASWPSGNGMTITFNSSPTQLSALTQGLLVVYVTSKRYK